MFKAIESRYCPKCDGCKVSWHHDNPADPSEWTPRDCVRCDGSGRVTTEDVEHVVKTREDMLKLSRYTLCNISDATSFANPIDGIPLAVYAGQYEGVVKTDWRGNFKSIR